jgi:hypothetical protein
VCSPSNDAAAVGAGGFGELDRGRGERQGRRDPGKRHLLKEAGGADMRVVERLLRGIDLSRHDIGRFERGQSLGAAARGTDSARSERRQRLSGLPRAPTRSSGSTSCPALPGSERPIGRRGRVGR